MPYIDALSKPCASWVLGFADWHSYVVSYCAVLGRVSWRIKFFALCFCLAYHMLCG